MGRIVVGVGADEVSDKAIEFAAKQALATDSNLELVSVWGLPAFLSKPAAAMGGEMFEVGNQFQALLDQRVAKLNQEYPELNIVAKAIEAPSPAKGLIDYAADADLLVLGTHSRSAVGRAVFGSFTYNVLFNLSIPTVVVPQG